MIYTVLCITESLIRLQVEANSPEEAKTKLAKQFHNIAPLDAQPQNTEVTLCETNAEENAE
jgi:hypothetical protein